MTRYITTGLVACAAVLMLSAAAYGQAATHEHEHATPPPAAQQAAGADHHAMMMSMMAEMQAKQKTLDDLVAKMNAAKGQEKIDLMAAVLTEMASMHKGMMCPMMQGGPK